MKKLLLMIMILGILTGCLFGCGNEAVSVEESSLQSASANVDAAPVEIRVAAIKGPTGVGMSKLMEESAAGNTENQYAFTLIGEAAEVVTKVIAGEFDIACLPTNSAAMLYQKTQGAVKLLALNTAGVLHMMQNTTESEPITNWEDMKGKTIYCLGQGANPEYVLDYVLAGNGIDPDKDVNIVFCAAADEIIAACAAGDCDICMLPEPARSTLVAKVPGFTPIFDMTDAWDQVVTDGSMLTMGCVVVQKDFYEAHPEAVEKFLEEYEASINYVQENPDEAVALIVAHGIVPSEAIARAALPGCNILFLAGQEMKDAISGYYQVLYDADPTSVGGAVPDEEFYCITK